MVSGCGACVIASGGSCLRCRPSLCLLCPLYPLLPLLPTLYSSSSHAFPLLLVLYGLVAPTRDLHGLANPHGSWVWVAVGMGVGWNFPTCQKPVPMGRVVWVGVGFFSGPPPPPPMTSDSMKRLYSQVTVAQPMRLVLSFPVSSLPALPFLCSSYWVS